MYKSIEISDVFGTLCSEGLEYDMIPMERIDSVFSRVHSLDYFVRIENVTRSLANMRDLLELEDVLFDNCIKLPQTQMTAERLEREYYRLDNETRILLTTVVREVFEL